VRSVLKILRAPLAASALVSVIISLGIIGLRNFGALEFLELAVYDWSLRLRPQAAVPDPRVLLITITEDDIRKQGRWPLTDDVLAQVLEIVARSRPRAIALDMYRDIPVPPGHDKFNATLTAHRNIIVTTKFADDPADVIPPPPALKDTEQVGFNDIPVDRDGIVRRGLLLMDYQEQTAYSFALRQALLYLGAEGIVPRPDESNPDHLRLGKATFRPFESNDGGYVKADAGGYQILLDFKTLQAPLQYFTLSALLSGQVPSAAIKDKAVLIGVTTDSVKDFFYTPYSRGLRAAEPVSGVALHGHIVSQLLRSALEGNPQIATSSDAAEVSWTLLWGVMGGALGLWVRSPWRYALLAGVGLLILGLAVYESFMRGWWIPSVPPALAWLASAGLVTAYMSNQEKKERAILMQLFSRHVAPEVAETMWQQRDQFMDGGRPRSQKLIATVFFTDLKGFTSVSEKMDPQGLMEWLNAYMETMAQLVMDHGGVVDDYLGDAIKANFGVPFPRTTDAAISQDAVAAIDCALAMERELRRLNALWQQQNLPTVGMRIGIFTGPVVAGSLGSTQRLKYTTVGDTVNTASRLETYDKDFAAPDFTNNPCRILIGETTFNYLDHQFETITVGEANLKGKGEKTMIYRVVGRKDGGARGVVGEVKTRGRQ
jgi:adenylate cyclase